MTDDERVSRGHAAQNELRLTAEAFEGIRTVLLEQIEETSPDQPAKILELHRSIQNLALVRKALSLVVQDGVVAAHAVAQAGLTRPN